MTLGGYDKHDYTGNMTWYDTSDCIGGWNLTTTVITLGDTDILPVAGETTVVEFQTAYPYIGVPKTTWTQVKELVDTTYNPDYTSLFTCGGEGNLNTYCYWRKTTCDELDLTANFTFTLGEYNFTIPLSNLASTTVYDSRNDCDLYLSLQVNNQTDNFIRLGDPFFASFMAVFDVENDNIGLALSARSYDGSAKVEWTDSPDPVDPEDPPVEFSKSSLEENLLD